MELIEPEDKEEEALPEPEPRPKSERPAKPAQSSQAWARLVAVAIVAVVLVVLLVLLARWIYHETHHSPANANTSPNTNQHAASANGRQKTSGASSLPNNKKPASPGGQSSAANRQLANTGPGNVAALFAGVSLAAAGLHFIISLRRLNKNGA